MTDALANSLRRIAKISYGATIEEASEVSKTIRQAADLIEQQAARIAELEALLVKANDAWLALSQTHSAAVPLHKFALIRDRNYEGEGLSLWTWNGENYSGADGDCLSPDPDGTLDGYTVEWLTDHQLEQRIDVLSKNAARYDFLRQRAELRQYEMGYYWHIKTVDVPMGMPAMAAMLANVIDWHIAASEPKNTGN